MNELINIETLKKLCSNEDNIIITQHTLTRCSQRNITIDEIIQAIKNGEIIEQCSDDYPNPSCLVLGITTNHKMLHVVCGTDYKNLWIITVYVPDKLNWEYDFKTRRKEQ